MKSANVQAAKTAAIPLSFSSYHVVKGWYSLMDQRSQWNPVAIHYQT